MQISASTGTPQKVISLRRSATPVDSSATWLRSSRNSIVPPSCTPLRASEGRAGERPEEDEETDDEAEVAEPVHHERLHARLGLLHVLVPEGDQAVAAEA